MAIIMVTALAKADMVKAPATAVDIVKAPATAVAMVNHPMGATASNPSTRKLHPSATAGWAQVAALPSVIIVSHSLA